MVFRRTLRRNFRATSFLARPAILERRRGCHHRRARTRRRRRLGRRYDRTRRQAAKRLHLPLRFCHARRPRGRHHLVCGLGSSLMFGFGILSCIVFLPLAGAGFILALRGNDQATLENARRAALGTTVIIFLLSLYAYARFDPSSSTFQLVEEKHWFGHGLVYKMGVDGISFPFVLLTTFLMPICILASWHSIQNRVKEYMITFLVLETLMTGVFCALDLLLLYLFFEGSLVPMFLIIGIWGHARRVYASFKFFLYTLAGSLLMLLAIMAMYGVAGTTDIAVLLQTHFPSPMQKWLWLGFFSSLPVKTPMWPGHTWA